MRSARVAVGAAVADAACIVVFAALGRASHDEGSAVGGTLEVAAPFLIGGAVGWAAARGWRAPTSLATGAAAWAGALVVGMLLRNLVWDRGTAPSFVIVTAIALGVLLLGWRLALRLRDARA
ncbi:MAG TPA: DUF3054 domain-containing protein [Miltoncostaeaceae bacterium]|nr:DUF3054 domain-containing protein [Miltoncostaeaceae bacterium]